MIQHFQSREFNHSPVRSDEVLRYRYWTDNLRWNLSTSSAVLVCPEMKCYDLLCSLYKFCSTNISVAIDLRKVRVCTR